MAMLAAALKLQHGTANATSRERQREDRRRGGADETKAFDLYPLIDSGLRGAPPAGPKPAPTSAAGRDRFYRRHQWQTMTLSALAIGDGGHHRSCTGLLRSSHCTLHAHQTRTRHAVSSTSSAPAGHRTPATSTTGTSALWRGPGKASGGASARFPARLSQRRAGSRIPWFTLGDDRGRPQRRHSAGTGDVVVLGRQRARQGLTKLQKRQCA